MIAPVTNFDTISPSFRSMPPTFRRWRLQEPVSYDVSYSLSGDRITVPRGFITDFASIPRVFWAIIPPFGRYAPASWVHDYLYETQTRTRKESDLIFLEAMKVLGVRRTRRTCMYLAVRVGGYIPWLRRKKRLEAG